MAIRPRSPTHWFATPASIAHSFHHAVADGVSAVAGHYASRPVVCSGGVFQNALLVQLVRERLGARAWFNATVPPNDGGLALGQAALAAFHSNEEAES